MRKPSRSRPARVPRHLPLLAAIDVGTNAVRLEIARALPDGSLETRHQERDPVRPGEGVFESGAMPGPVVDRLVAVLRRYAALCRRDGARVRAVATSALREARNQAQVLRRIRRETGLELEVVSGREEARLICLGVLQGRRPGQRALLVDIGGGSTEVASADGQEPRALHSVALGAVRLSELFGGQQRLRKARLAAMRAFADEAFRESLPARLSGPRVALGSSGTIAAVVGFAAGKGGKRATAEEVRRAASALARMTPAERRRHFDPRRAEIVTAGAVILERAMHHLRLEAMVAVETGLRNGLLVDLVRRAQAREDHTAAEAALALGRRLGFDERHAVQVGALAVTLFEDLAPLHRLPAAARPVLEAAAVLHDVGNAVSFHRHHKHTAYLVANADLPGLGERERQLAALVARFHRRSFPDPGREDLAHLGAGELRTLRRLAALLRVANALDASHQGAVRSLRAEVRGRTVLLRLRARGPLDLELWDLGREAELFRQVFRRRIELHTDR
ncbi:MAG: Ppx/GppA family phosphatase [Deltaproteobacteria bacterium]|nr:Ppx/GppA family phosphatase [Deltaproteobacteria bacterium]